MFSPRNLRVVLISLSTLAAYVLTGWLGMAVPLAPPNITLFWPPIGIALTVLYRFGWRYWPIVFLSTVIVNSADVPLWCSLQVAIGNTLAPLVAALILRVLRFQNFENTLRDLAKMMAACKLSAIVSAGNGALTLWLNEPSSGPEAFQRNLIIWWMGDFAGLLLVGLLGLTVRFETMSELRQNPRLFLAYLTVLVIIALVLFTRPFPDRADFKILTIAGMGIVATVLAINTSLPVGLGLTLLLACIGVVGTAQGYGPLVDPTSYQVTLTSAWSWLIMTMLIVTIVGSLHHALKKALAELDVEKQSYQALVEGNPALIVRFSDKGDILFANDTANRLLIEPGQTIIGENITRYIPKDDLYKVYELLVSPDTPTSMDLQMTAVDGSQHVIRWKASNLRRGSSLPPEYLAVGFDVTDLRRAERERREFLERLYHSKKLESLGVMAGGIAHDFNNLLTGVLGHTELAKELVSSDEPIGQHIIQIEQSAYRAAELVQQMMAYAGQTRVKIARFDLNELIRSTLELIQINLTTLSDRIELVFTPSETTLMIEADPVQLRQVMMNLVINAGEAIGENSGKIVIQSDSVTLRGDELLDSTTSETRVNLPPGDYIRVRVRDTGRGMDEATRKRIFEPFFSTKFQGRGLGLASVLGIIQAHSGTIGVSSHPGRGTLFTFLLPANYRKPSDAVGTPPIQGISSTNLRALPANGLVFVCLDSLEQRTLVADHLKLLGWQIVTENVLVQLHEAIQASVQMPIVVVIDRVTDNPTQRGIHQLLKKYDALLYTIVVTEFDMSRITEETQFPASTFLIAPFSPTDIMNAMIRLFYLISSARVGNSVASS